MWELRSNPCSTESESSLTNPQGINMHTELGDTAPKVFLTLLHIWTARKLKISKCPAISRPIKADYLKLDLDICNLCSFPNTLRPTAPKCNCKDGTPASKAGVCWQICRPGLRRPVSGWNERWYHQGEGLCELEPGRLKVNPKPPISTCMVSGKLFNLSCFWFSHR